MSDSISILKDKVAQSKQIAIVPHKGPDGDAIGSTLGLYHFLKQFQPNVKVIIPDEFPFFLDFLPGSETIVNFEKDTEAAIEFIENSDVIFSLDHGQINRCGDIAPFVANSKAYKAVIDHHPDVENVFNFYFHDIKASSACELVTLFIKTWDADFAIDKTMATCLYAGILTDTGSFKFALRKETFQVAELLFSAGIDPAEISGNLFDVNTPERLKVLGFALNERLTVLPEYKTAFMALSYEDLQQFNLQKGDSEGLVNYTLSLQGMQFGIFFREQEPGETRISFRSKGSFPANEFSSRYFNGGGHLNAAGGINKEPLKETVEKFLSLLPDYYKEKTS